MLELAFLALLVATTAHPPPARPALLGISATLAVATAIATFWALNMTLQAPLACDVLPAATLAAVALALPA